MPCDWSSRVADSRVHKNSFTCSATCAGQRTDRGSHEAHRESCTARARSCHDRVVLAYRGNPSPGACGQTCCRKSRGSAFTRPRVGASPEFRRAAAFRSRGQHSQARRRGVSRLRHSPGSRRFQTAHHRDRGLQHLRLGRCAGSRLGGSIGPAAACGARHQSGLARLFLIPRTPDAPQVRRSAEAGADPCIVQFQRPPVRVRRSNRQRGKVLPELRGVTEARHDTTG